MKKNVCFVFVFFGVCTLFLGHTAADYFVKIGTITSGEIVDTTTGTTTTVIPTNPIVFSPNGNLLASGSTTGHVVLWDPETGEVVRRLDRGTTDRLGSQGIAFNDAGTRIAAGGYDQKVYVWNPNTGRRLQARTHGESVLSVAFAVDGYRREILYSQGATRVKTWKSGEEDPTHTHNVANTAGAPNEVRVAMVATPASGHLNRTKRILIGRANGKIEVRQATDFIAFAVSNPRTDEVTSPIWSLAAWDEVFFVTGHDDGKVRLWETKVIQEGQSISLWDDAAIKKSIKKGVKHNMVLAGTMIHSGVINALAYFSAENASWESTASGSTDGSVFVFKSKDDDDPFELEHPDLDETDTWKPRVYSVSYGFKEHKGATLASYAETPEGLVNVTNRNIQLWANRDVDNDGDLDRDDLIAIAERYGDGSDSSYYDVDDDKSFDIDDIVLVAEALDLEAETQDAPVLAQNTAQPVTLDSQKVQQILHDARQINANARVIALLEALLKEATLQQTGAPPPAKTALFANYPNPFNPETWIPYELATPTEVTVDIHSATGQLVRTLRLGHQPAGTYRAQPRAAYWDGRNTEGEPVASGVYFYTLRAGEFIATRKMLIRK